MKCPACDGSGTLTEEQWTIGYSILAARRERGLTQAQLAALVGITRPQIANIEGGRSDMPTETLLRFAKALNMKAGELLP